MDATPPSKQPAGSHLPSLDDDRSFLNWYRHTVGRWWIVSQIAFWFVFFPFPPMPWLLWRFFKWWQDWHIVHGSSFVHRHEDTRVWVEPTITKRGRFRRGYWRRK